MALDYLQLLNKLLQPKCNVIIFEHNYDKHRICSFTGKWTVRAEGGHHRVSLWLIGVVGNVPGMLCHFCHPLVPKPFSSFPVYKPCNNYLWSLFYVMSLYPHQIIWENAKYLKKNCGKVPFGVQSTEKTLLCWQPLTFVCQPGIKDGGRVLPFKQKTSIHPSAILQGIMLWWYIMLSFRKFLLYKLTILRKLYLKMKKIS